MTFPTNGEGKEVAGVEPAASPDRRRLFETYGPLYGDLHVALTFTRTNDPRRGDMKQGMAGWPQTQPLPHAARGLALMTSRGLHGNSALVARASRLIVIETDTAERLAEFEALGLPATVTVQSSAPWKRHHWFRSWADEMPPFSAIRMEAAGITVDTDRLFLVPPSIHPTGATYTFVRSPEDVAIATMPELAYRRLVSRARRDENGLRQGMAEDVGFKVPEGARREMLFRFACMCRRWTASEALIRELAMTWNAAMCDPPLSAVQVAHQVGGAMRKPGGQNLEPARMRELVGRATGGS